MSNGEAHGFPAEPIGMKCEHPGCNENKGQDYHRIGEERVQGWEDEPIWLCDEHKGEHIPYTDDFNAPTAALVLECIIGIHEGRYVQLKPLEDYIKDFANYHRLGALNAAAENVGHKHKTYDTDFKINKKTILDAYPKERIK